MIFAGTQAARLWLLGHNGPFRRKAESVHGTGPTSGQGPAAKVTCKTGSVAKLYPLSSNGDGDIGAGLAPRSDGYVADVITFQGVRSYDPNAGQWTTPDAYAGDEHDPMSQKPFMWNFNNPFEYADPDGTAPEPIGGTVARRARPDLFNRDDFVGAMASAIGPSAADFASNAAPTQLASRNPEKKKQPSKKTKKERSTRRPSWLSDASPIRPEEIPQDYAARILNEKYGPGKWRKGGNSEFSEIVKYLTRSGKK